MNSSNDDNVRSKSFCLEFAAGPRAGEQIPLGHDPVVIGRSQEADVTLDDQAASRKHAEIAFRDGAHVVVDHSSNGTYVNGALASDKPLQPGDQILIGETTLKYVAVEPEPQPPSPEPQAPPEPQADEQQPKPDEPAKPRVGSPVMLGLVVLIAALIAAAPKLLTSKAKPAKPAANAPASKATTQTAAPVTTMSPQDAIKAIERMLADARVQPRFVVDALDTCTQARVALGASDQAGKAELAGRLDELAKQARQLQADLCKTFERKAKFAIARRDYAQAKQYLDMLKAVLGDARAPAYLRAEKALAQLPRTK